MVYKSVKLTENRYIASVQYRNISYIIVVYSVGTVLLRESKNQSLKMLRSSHANSSSSQTLPFTVGSNGNNSSSSNTNQRNNSTTSGSGSICNRMFQFLANRRKDSLRNNLFFLLVLIVLLWLFMAFIAVCQDLFPETDMVINSQCHNPIQNWDGKLFDIPLWSSAFTNRPLHYNLHFERRNPPPSAGYNPADIPVTFEHAKPVERPVIIWATHHKTGTFLAKKIFSKVCARMQWCCIFHVTRDSVHLLNNVLHEEPVDAMGHNQWIWHPHDLNITNYRFIHFYRNPFRKVISGFNYHYDGTEAWTQKPLKYGHICNNVNRLIASAKDVDGTNCGESKAKTAITLSTGANTCKLKVDTNALYDFCESTYLCETCCRKEHELPSPENEKTLDINEKVFILRDKTKEYKYMCDHLGSIQNGTSIQTTFLTVPPERGILIEAALDYYENLRMANLVNQTVNDPHAINVDLDFLTSEYDTATMQILMHLKDFIPKDMIASLHYDLKFYDLNNSPLYRWSMSNPLVNHVTQSKTNEGHGKSSKDLMQILVSDPAVMELYSPIFDLMHAIVKKPLLKVASTPYQQTSSSP